MKTLVIGEIILIVILFLLIIALLFIKIQIQKTRTNIEKLKDEIEAYKSGFMTTNISTPKSKIVTPQINESSGGPRGSRVVPVTELKPGDKLAKEVLYDNGTILLNKGTILTKHYIDKLRENYITEVEIEI